MAFDALHGSFPKPFYPTFQRQASVNMANGNNGGVGLAGAPAASVFLKEQEAESSVAWFHRAGDDPGDLDTGGKISPDCSEEADLQVLVSSILDEADLYSSCSEGKQPPSRPVWSAAPWRGEHPNGEAFPPNCQVFSVESCDDGREPGPPPDRLPTNQWPPGSFLRLPLRPPPGLPAPHTGSDFLSALDGFPNVPSEAQPTRSGANSLGLRYADLRRHHNAAGPLVSGFQAFHADHKTPERDGGWRAGSGPMMSSTSATVVSPPCRQLLGEFWMQQERNARDVRMPPKPPSPARIRNNFQNHHEKQWIAALAQRLQNMPPFTPPTFPLHNFRGSSGPPVYPPVFSPRRAAAATPTVQVGDAVSRTGESGCHMTMAPLEEGGAVVQLYFHLDESYEQWNCLEKERKKAEVVLSRAFPGKRTAEVTNHNAAKTSPNPTRVDHLVVSQMKAQAKMMNLLYRMECLSSSALHPNLHAALKKHELAVREVQARRREELAYMSTEPRRRGPLAEDRDTLLLAAALRQLTAATRSLRTALWCGLQTALPRPAGQPDGEEERSAGPASPLQGYSFTV